MGDKFSITVSPGDLSSAETLLGDLARNVEEEGTKLADLPGKAGSWTGTTATTLKAEMTRIAGQMKSSPEHFATAKTAVGAFRGKIEDAQKKLLELNHGWTQSVTTYDGAVTAAGRDYDSTTGPYRHMPDADSADLLREARGKRARAISAAAGVRDAEQRKLQGEYEALVHDLEAAAATCGSALAAAVLVAVPAEVVSTYLSGGGMGAGALDADFDKLTKDARQKLTGDDSLVGRADDLKAGEELARTVGDKVRKGEQLTPEEIAYLKANAKNQAFVQGFMQTMGPEALAALSYTTLIDVEQGTGDEKKNADALKSALTDLYTTGSHIQVDDGHGGQRYLMDDGWLNNFVPKRGLPDIPGYSGVPDHGYAPGTLLPFLTQPLSENFSKVIGDRWLRDYEEAKKNGDAGGVYEKYHTPIGDHDVTSIVFDRIADHPNVSNDLMTSHTQTFMDLFAGKDKFLIGEVNDEPDIRRQLNTILQRGVLEVTDPQHRSNADYIVASMGKYLADPKHKDDKFLKEVLPALGAILKDDRYFGGQIMSVATPFAPPSDPNAGFPAYSRDPNYGFLMDPALWAQLQQEALRNPENAQALAAKTADFIDKARTASEGRAWSYADGEVGPDGRPLTGPSGVPFTSDGNFSLVGLDLYQQEAVRAFFGKNLLAVKDELTAEMEKKVAAAGKPAEYGTAVVGKLFEWISDPKAIPGDVGKMTFDTTVGLVAKEYTADAEKDIKADYNKRLNALTKSVDESFVDPGFWDKANGAADRLAVNYEPGRTPPSVWAEGDQAKGGPAERYVGDPKRYVGHTSEFVNGTVMTDDFLEYDDTGNVTGVVDPHSMNSLQREAYLNWLKDPAVQQYLDENVDAVDKAVARAGK